ncbi:hypothetical protein E3T40_15385 [Cryobacterium sp. TMT1-19]|uniref:hypothetical protein n=1 Tax=unclassified Cryobacterium TaxID=2649013 RepID=UPI00106BA173|nr:MULTISPECIES: hypothetical protein [unclassified Cryobacterium]TFD30374.1 hypothetical protein E3T40_15385 [Cryobacterium sp. TMT1-19]
MSAANWREVWPLYRVKLVDETARCLAEQQSAATSGQRPRWEELTGVQQKNLAENIAGIFLAQDQAMHNLVERGLKS